MIEQNSTAPASWRSLTRGDVPDVHALQIEVEEHDRLPFRTTAAEIDDLFRPEFDHSGYGAFDASGRLLAYGFVRVVNSDGLVRAMCSGAVHPTWRQQRVGTTILEWEVETAHGLLARRGSDEPAQIAQYCDDSVPEMHDLLQRNGFTARRWISQMRRDLTREIDVPELGRNLTFETWSDDWDDVVRRAHVQAYAEFEEGSAIAAEQWEKLRENLVGEWSGLILDRSSDRARVAGYVMCSRWEADWEALGWKEGYIDALGILAPWRGQGIGHALLAQAMGAFRESGMDFAGVDASSDDLQGLYSLYERMGFEPTHRATFYAIDI